MEGEHVIEIEHATFTYEGASKPSLTDFSFTAKRGECILLCGKSGCGKTTVTRLLNGLIPRFFEGIFEGKAAIGEVDVTCDPMDDIVNLVGSVFQDPRSQFFTTDTTSEVAFTCENMGLKRAELLRRVASASKRLDLADLLNRNIFQLSSGEKQRVAIASAYAFGPSIFVLDEPSANLDTESTSELASILAQLKNEGHTLVISEHRLFYLRELVDRVILLEDGAQVREYQREEFLSLSEADLAQAGLRTLRPKELKPSPRSLACSNSIIFQVNDLTFSYRRNEHSLVDISFSAHAGEVIALVGHNGAGKSTLAGLLCGLNKPRSGMIQLKEKKARAKDLTKTAYYIMQDADYQLFTESVVDELQLESRANTTAVEKVLEALALLDLRDRHPASLSGGQKQRVTIGTALMKDAAIIEFDEPTSGLDAENMRRVAQQIELLAEKGRVVIVITHDYELILQCCTRILEMENGSLKADYELSDKTMGSLQRSFFN